MYSTKSTLGPAFFALVSLTIAACGGSSGTTPPPPPPPPPPPAADITLGGGVFDGPVSGGSIFVFTADTIIDALADANGAADRAAALSAADPVATLTRDEADEESFSLTVSGDLAGQGLFVVFDSLNASDGSFGDQPFNLESVVIAGEAGATQRINLTPHTTLAAIAVRAALDPDGDGAVIDDAAIAAELEAALGNALAAFGEDDFGEDLLGGEDPATSEDSDVLTAASTAVGLAVRLASGFTGLDSDEIVRLFGADLADGNLDGTAAQGFALSVEEEEALVAAVDSVQLGRINSSDGADVSCRAAAAQLRRSCEFEVLDEFFTASAICAHSADDVEAEACFVEAGSARDEVIEECGAVNAARLEVCTVLNDAPHDPPFGPGFESSFIDPMLIGAGVAPNPYFPLVQGNEWIFEGTFEEDGEMITETITITVTDRVKLIDGIQCLVVRDVVEIDGELIEDTDDWFAQDTIGNLWYCGEEVKDYETFEGDEPPLPELVAIDGAFKAGRDGDEAGVNLPFAPVIGDLHRQEMSVANAEDIIEILSITASETTPAASCTNDCLLTRDFSPLDPGSEENKYYAPGIGKILEINLETGNRVELISFTTTP